MSQIPAAYPRFQQSPGYSPVPAADIGPERPPTVLIVEDEPAIAEMMTLLLTRAGYLAHWIGDGATLTAATARWRPDLMIVDLVMPGRNGFVVCTQAKAAAAAPAVLVVSTRDDPEWVELARICGADDHLAQPFKAAALLSRVSAMLRRARHPARDAEGAAQPAIHPPWEG
ncbi:response regulator transcription factor [Nocardia cyriacigeorgica]|uniref:response regulator transcription factor n=1 Tax=Nocardia cyriacigeorgica TaxID=135487 RepID=UPI0018938769|nr:response regulator transcription factor [Nocardia cyriacigeorgica]MBF6415370.1 response regulator transcription factor [Nocardia cyriacigeorgica]